MKLSLNAALICSALIFSGCGAKKNSSDSSMSQKYTLAVFNDYNLPSTFDESKLGNIPKSINLKDSMTHTKDQDDRGTCSHFTSAGLVESAIKRKMKVDVNLSEEYFSYSSKENGYFSQTEAGNSLTNLYTAIINKKDFLLEKDWPYQPMWFGLVEACDGFSVDDEKAPKECYSHNAPPAEVMAKKIPADKFELYEMKGTTNEMIEQLATTKMPMSIAVPVNARGWKNSGEVEYTEELRAECIKSPELCGSHEVIITGYDLEKKVFFFRNSWGKSWGDDGYGTFPIDMIDRHARHYNVMVDLEEDIILPADHSTNPVTLGSFNVTSLASADNSVKITTSGNVSNVGYHTLKVGSTLMMKAKGISGPINDSNAETVMLNLEESSKFEVEAVTNGHIFLAENDSKNFVLTGKADAVMNINSDLMSSKSVQDLISDYRQLYFRTTLYMYSDDGGYKVLKRYYHGGNY